MSSTKLCHWNTVEEYQKYLEIISGFLLRLILGNEKRGLKVLSALPTLSHPPLHLILHYTEVFVPPVLNVQLLYSSQHDPVLAIVLIRGFSEACRVDAKAPS